ncbi:MAG: pentapeptide repeat-containing protein [Acidobacteria bacterium]|jgi:uncharacterized protein YjbI with pentapeptide repeats|nr:pentapeptide repeat-containing protein [Acidobacteriota bacterium]
MDNLNLRLVSLAGAFAAFAAPGALAQGQPVAWSPSYVGTCATCELSGRNLTGWTLAGANYSEAKLDYSVMRGVQATAVNFERADLTGADMRGAVLTNAKLADAIFAGTRLQEITASGADLRRALLHGASLQDAVLIGANFEDAELNIARLEDADMSTANFDGAVFDRANLRGAIFNGANFKDARFKGADITGASFKDARFPGASLEGVKGFAEADFEGACGSLSTRLPPEARLPLCTNAQLSAQLSADLD